MQDRSDAQLLREYAQSGTEGAFREIVERYANLVYSAAARQVDSTDLAEDIAQQVFIDLARKARSVADRLTPPGSLVGWLYQSTRFSVLKLLRAERRRQFYEKRAMELQDMLHDDAKSAPDWDQLRPFLDDAMFRLDEPDRTALLLRFFQTRNLRSVGEALGISEDAAQKRVSRGLLKLRDELARHGFTAAGHPLDQLLTNHAILVAPAKLTATISKAVLATTGIHTATAITATKTIAMTTIQKSVIGLFLAAVAGTGVYEAHQASLLRNQIQSLGRSHATLNDQLAEFKSANQRLSNQLAQATQSAPSSTERLREVLRLRGEVTLLRRQQRELQQALADSRSKANPPPGKPAPAWLPPSPGPSPFQVQLVTDQPGDNSETLTNLASGARGEVLQVQKSPLLDYTAIQSASVTQDPSSGAPEISVEFSKEGSELFSAITRENLNRRLAIVLNGQVYSAPVIKSEISGGKAQITGNFTPEQAQELAARINQMVANP